MRHHRRQPGIEHQTDAGPERHDRINEHRHPGSRHMNENNPVRLTLLEIGWREEKCDIQADQPEQRGKRSEPRQHLASQRVKSLWGGILEPAHVLNYSNAIFNAAAVAHGANTSAANAIAPSSDKCAASFAPAADALTAPAPNTNTGTYNGSTSSALNAPAPRTPSVSAAPTAPINDNAGVAISRDSDSVTRARPGRSNCSPSSGAISTNGNPVVSQCAAILDNTINTGGCGTSISCSRVPSAKSASNILASDNSAASNAATHTTPGAISRNVSDC